MNTATLPSEDTERSHARVDAEINKLVAESLKLQAESNKFAAEKDKLMREALKLEREHWWYPAWVGASLIGAGAAAGALVVKLLLG